MPLVASLLLVVRPGAPSSILAPSTEWNAKPSDRSVAGLLVVERRTRASMNFVMKSLVVVCSLAWRAEGETKDRESKG